MHNGTSVGPNAAPTQLISKYSRYSPYLTILMSMSHFRDIMKIQNCEIRGLQQISIVQPSLFQSSNSSRRQGLLLKKANYAQCPRSGSCGLRLLQENSPAQFAGNET
jgi:hypothetical protein